jgi:tetratricopeptide (TPR) repeat protein
MSLTMLTVQPIPANHYRPYAGSPYLFLALAWAGRRWLLSRLGAAIWTSALVFWVGISFHHAALASDVLAYWGHCLRYGASEFGVVRSLQRIEDPRVRQEAVSAALERFPDQERLWWLRGISGLQLGHLEAGITDLQRSLPEGKRGPAADSGVPAVARGLLVAQFAIQSGEVLAAEQLVTLLVTADPENWTARYLLGFLLQRKGRLEEAVAAYRAAEGSGGSSVHLRRNLGMTLRQLGRCDEAVPAFRRALAVAPTDPVSIESLRLCEVR